MKFSYLLIAAVILCSACSKTRKAPNGLEMEVVKDGDGKFAEPGQFIVMNMLYKDSKDSVWADTRKRGIPLIIPVGDTSLIKSEKGIESTFRVMKKGDSLLFKMDAKTLFDGQPMPPTIKPDEKLTFLFGIIEITDRDGVNKLQSEFQAKEMEKSKQLANAQLAIDSVAIDNYLAEKKIVALKATSGVRYVIHVQGTGEKPSLSSTVIAKYRGTLLSDGTEFDAGPLEYPLAGLVKGWQIAFPLLAKGTKATIYIPSSLGYGATGAPPNIPANANLVFEIELIDFK
ncbi:MAG: hypothetical protein HOP08_06840 [Cyclobacteriaceae bacterium]|nr:hypothetical protein [Cyclobacteriaceae bacterium]